MKILVWCPLYSLGGGHRLFNHFIKALSRSEDISLLKIVQSSDLSNSFDSDEINLDKSKIYQLQRPRYRWYEKNGRIIGIPGTGRIRSIFRQRRDQQNDTLQYRQLKEISDDCDIFYCFWPHFQDFPEMIRTPIVCTIQDSILFDFPELVGGVNTFHEWSRQRKWLESSKAVVVSSEATKKSLTEHFGGYQTNVAVIRHDALPDIALRGMGETLNNDVNLPTNYIVYPANISPHKNHYNLLIAWSRFSKRKEYPLVFFGGRTESMNVKGPDWPEDFDWQQVRLSGLIQRLGLKAGEDFHALGYLHDKFVMPIISRATGLIMPSLAEGGGSYPVEEALSKGIPVLCSDIPVMHEHIGGRSAKIAWFDPEFPESILKALNGFIENYREYKESAVEATRDPRPTWDEIAAGYVKVFKEVMICL